MSNEYCVACPSFKFKMEGMAVQGYVTAPTFEEAIEVLKKIQIGPRTELEVTFGGEKSKVIKGSSFTIEKEPSDVPVQIAYINEK